MSDFFVYNFDDIYNFDNGGNLPDFLGNCTQFDDSYDWSTANKHDVISVNNNILKNKYRFSIIQHLANNILNNILWEKMNDIERQESYQAIAKKYTISYTTKYNYFLITLRFTINNDNFSKHLAIIVTSNLDSYINIDTIEPEDFDRILSILKIDLSMHYDECWDLYNFVRQNEVEYLNSDKHFFKNYDRLCRYNDIEIYKSFDFQMSHIIQKCSSFVFVKNSESYEPESLAEYCWLCYLGQEAVRGKEPLIPVEVEFETYDVRSVLITYHKAMQVLYNDIWVTVPDNLPDKYRDEFYNLKEIFTKRRTLFDKLTED